MKRIEGRQGEATEFVEFEPKGRLPGAGSGPQTRIVAQKGSGGFWFVFQVSTRKGGSVRTLDSFETKEQAVKKAQEIAEEMEA